MVSYCPPPRRLSAHWGIVNMIGNVLRVVPLLPILDVPFVLTELHTAHQVAHNVGITQSMGSEE